MQRSMLVFNFLSCKKKGVIDLIKSRKFHNVLFLLPVLGKAEASAYLQVNSGSVGSYINHGKKNLIKEPVASVLRDILPTNVQNALHIKKNP